ncbi:DRTGG domain-containing protein [Latilactobacillus sakei]|uniref:DRTGG domain-containing protein n=1 Tax=Latilactobacillus sakei TaxID=1599 RepID=UPI000FFC8FA6|nr:DRTGG domain-containing protein [Latilactobacillus sakei]RXA82006.1 CBS domain-containing protein [Latilactobacillus sakei]UNC20991.1 CBS domain-containing protein [Latilactobacillus sakei]UNC22722.1 CBS domain-containing protein [Latilactobacillus sakei]
MATKHDQILMYIENLPIGDKISVRSIAKTLAVSEGTAYRAIKAAENNGLVSTIERVGTIRIEQKLKGKIENLTFAEIVQVIDGEVLGGKDGLNKLLDKFVIGAMQLAAITRYITPKSLLIVGDRIDVQRLALENGAAVLITGGFHTSDEVIALANELALPILQTTYDTYTVATLINRALTDQLIKKEITTVASIYRPFSETYSLLATDTVGDYKKLSAAVKHSRFPVINEHRRLVGIVTVKDILDKPASMTLDKVMTKEPASVKKYMSIASVGHAMTWNSLEIMPVVADNLELEGIITRQDVMSNMQTAQRQPQVAETFYDQIIELLHPSESFPEFYSVAYQFEVSPQMTNNLGTISFGVLSEAVSAACQRMLQATHQRHSMIEQINLHYLRLIQIESQIQILPRILEIGRRSAKIDVDVYANHVIVAKAIVTCQILERG